MPSTQAQLRATLRRRLRDESAELWPDAVLDGHLQSAVRLVAARRPRATSLTRIVPPLPRRVDLSADVGTAFLWLEAVEYPLDRWPPALLPFREEPGPKAYLLSAALPTPGDLLRIWYAAGYALDEATSDLPAVLDEVVLEGALALALEDRAVEEAGAPVPGGRAGEYRELARASRARFEVALAGLTGAGGAPVWRPSWSSGPPDPGP